MCCKHYSNHSMKNSKNRFQFLKGDKVCATKNASIPHCDSETEFVGDDDDDDNEAAGCSTKNTRKRKEKRKKPEVVDKYVCDCKPQLEPPMPKETVVRVCNGEIFYIVKVRSNCLGLQINSGTNVIIIVTC